MMILTKEMQNMNEILNLSYIVNQKTDLAVCCEFQGYNDQIHFFIYKSKNFASEKIVVIFEKRINLKSKQYGYCHSRKERYKGMNLVKNVLNDIMDIVKFNTKKHLKKVDTKTIIDKLLNDFPNDIIING